MKHLRDLMTRYPQVMRDVRGRGLLIGIELPSESMAGLLMAELVRRGVIAAYTLNNPTIIRLEPPLIIRREEVDAVLSRLEESLRAVRAYDA